MCTFPGCRTVDFKLKGSISKPPKSGWKIQQLPEAAQHLAAAWAQFTTQPGRGKAARWDMLNFLAANGIKGPAITAEVYDISVHQWCRDEPKRCYGYKTTPNLPWAKALWESSNNMLNDEVEPEDVRKTLVHIIELLTKAIEGPEGCPRCARHWRDIRKAHPLPDELTLDEARHWLVDRHNDTRDGKPPTPFEVVAAKFNWGAAE